MTRITKRKFKSLCFYVGSWFVSCFLFVALYFYGKPTFTDPALYVITFQFALLAGLSHGIYDVVILQDDKDHRPVWAALLIRSLHLFSNVIINMSLCVFVWSLNDTGKMITEESLNFLFYIFTQPEIQVFAIYSFLMGFMITFIRSAHKKFGTRVFVNTLLGKYQEPTEEERVFMFVDLRHSTRLAEELGHFVYSNFLKDYYHLLSNCCEENRGEIYQIAGDGVYITWPIERCKNKPRPMLCFYDLKLCFERTRKNFEKEYGVYPTFKAAAHCGKVIVTEVGNFGSEIAFHGDAMNTTARLQDLCSPLGKEFIVSEDLLKKLPDTEIYHPQAQGIYELKGKKNGISIYTLNFSLDNHK